MTRTDIVSSRARWSALTGGAVVALAWLAEAALTSAAASGGGSLAAAILDTEPTAWIRRVVLAAALGLATALGSRAARRTAPGSPDGVSPDLARRVFDNTVEGIVVTDPEGTIQMVNPAFSDITGYSADEAVGKNPRILKSDRHDPDFYRDMWLCITERGQWSGEIWNRNKAGEAYCEWLTISAVRDEAGRITHYVSVFHDLSDLNQRNERIRHLAYHDALTGLPNRMLLDDRLNQALAHARRAGSWTAVLFFDLDEFKQVNDQLGHLAGDRVLQVVADRLQSRIRDQDTVARHGGDEFVVVASDLTSSEDAVHVAEQLGAAIRQPIELQGRSVEITASIGVALYPGSGSSPESLIAQADNAMYRAKGRGRARVEVADARAPAEGPDAETGPLHGHQAPSDESG